MKQECMYLCTIKVINYSSLKKRKEMKNLQPFADKSKAGRDVRNENIALLKGAGFIESGVYSCSGELRIDSLKTKTVLVFGMRSNIGGKRNKYFSLKKDYDSREDAIKDFNHLSKKLKQA